MKGKIKEWMKYNNKVFIASIILIASLLLGLYVGGWVMIVKSIIAACGMYDLGTLTGAIIAKTILKCFLGPVVFGFIYSIGYVVSSIIVKY